MIRYHKVLKDTNGDYLCKNSFKLSANFFTRIVAGEVKSIRIYLY